MTTKKIKGKRLRLSAEEVDIINEFRGDSLENINGNTALDIHLKERGINKKDVVSVKHLQSMSGELRFSIKSFILSSICSTTLSCIKARSLKLFLW